MFIEHSVATLHRHAEYIAVIVELCHQVFRWYELFYDKKKRVQSQKRRQVNFLQSSGGRTLILSSLRGNVQLSYPSTASNLLESNCLKNWQPKWASCENYVKGCHNSHQNSIFLEPFDVLMNCDQQSIKSVLERTS